MPVEPVYSNFYVITFQYFHLYLIAEAFKAFFYFWIKFQFSFRSSSLDLYKMTGSKRYPPSLPFNI